MQSLHTPIALSSLFKRESLSVWQLGKSRLRCLCYCKNKLIMKNKHIITITTLCLVIVAFFVANGCEKDASSVPYKRCIYEEDYMDTVSIEGAGYLFINSIPAGLQKEENVMYIIYNKEDNSATFSAVYPTEAIYNGNICNFPNFAKEWKIPSDGKQIYYKGELYVTGRYAAWPPHTGGNLILTTLK